MKEPGQGIFRFLRVLPNKTSAMTLVEIMVTVFILSVVSAGLFMALRIGDFSNVLNSEKVDIQAEARRTMECIAKDVRQTTGYEIANNNPSESYLKFRLCRGHDGSNLIWSANYVEYNYDSTNHILLRVDNNTGETWQFNNIAAAPFNVSEVLTNKKLYLTITIEKQEPRAPPITFTLTGEVKIRNG
jgi:type II secretory pathway pseudopilin PulG